VFRRLNRAVELTEAGRVLAPGITDGFAALSAAWRNTQRLNDNSTLTITAGPAFTSKWLAPRLYEFAQAHPEIELRFSASLRIVDFDRDAVDVAIRFGLGHDKDVYSEPFVQEWMTPMMTPDLAEEFGTLVKLSQAPLIHDESIAFFKQPTDWPAWCVAAGVGFDTSSGLRFSQADHALDAAISGAGVVLGRVSLATRALEQGRLVAPFKTGLLTEAQFRFICPQGTENRPHVAAFRAWVFKEIHASKAFEVDRTLVAPQA
jgi:LysR family glycine cleavage system transcriptional activator